MMPHEQQVYQDWLTRSRPLLEAKQWSEAMRDVPRLVDLEPAIPRPLARPLAESTVALVTSAGITQPDQAPMDGENIEGDYTIRLLDIGTPSLGAANLAHALRCHRRAARHQRGLSH